MRKPTRTHMHTHARLSTHMHTRTYTNPGARATRRRSLAKTIIERIGSWIHSRLAHRPLYLRTCGTASARRRRRRALASQALTFKSTTPAACGARGRTLGTDRLRHLSCDSEGSDTKSAGTRARTSLRVASAAPPFGGGDRGRDNRNLLSEKRRPDSTLALCCNIDVKAFNGIAIEASRRTSGRAQVTVSFAFGLLNNLKTVLRILCWKSAATCSGQTSARAASYLDFPARQSRASAESDVTLPFSRLQYSRKIIRAQCFLGRRALSCTASADLDYTTLGLCRSGPVAVVVDLAVTGYKTDGLFILELRRARDNGSMPQINTLSVSSPVGLIRIGYRVKGAARDLSAITAH
ncbi:hypothetical protein EVAR_35235_1 [Eumeta japonica]|uniref:Uncharacterized protein n=1 Tax=Eumeta variegata TaxID=151549 RepID=A0A4C1VCS2_EUMVA|nr:hypothetical protein EVAR_35235_1 [Eumeta japonica]